jgi:hypothetical protein
MKKILAILLFSAITAIASAQATHPRFGTPPSGDNTGQSVTYAYSNVAYGAGLKINPNAFETVVTVGTLTGTQTDTVYVKNSHVCDRLTLVFVSDTAAAGHVVTFGLNFVSTGTLTVNTSKKATASFIFDGTAYVETARARQ